MLGMCTLLSLSSLYTARLKNQQICKMGAKSVGDFYVLSKTPLMPHWCLTERGVIYIKLLGLYYSNDTPNLAQTPHWLSAHRTQS